jgi:signal transduction histidine kinase
LKLQKLTSTIINRIIIAVLAAGGIITLVALVFPPGILLRLLPFIAAIAGAVAVFILSKQFSTQVISPVKNLLYNTEKLAEDPGYNVRTVQGTFEEFERITQNLENIASNMVESKGSFGKLKTDYDKKAKTAESLGKTVGSSFNLEVKINDFLNAVKDEIGVTRYLLFIRDESLVLKRKFFQTEDKDSFDQISLSDSGRDPLVTIFKNGIPQLIDNVKQNRNLQGYAREWAMKNDIDRILAVPVKSGNIVYALLLFTGKIDPDFKVSDSSNFSLALELIGNLFREEAKVSEVAQKCNELVLEASVGRCIIQNKEFNRLFESFLLILSEKMNIDWGGIAFVEQEGADSYLIYSLSFAGKEKQFKKGVAQLQGSALAWVRNNKRPWVDDDITMAKSFFEDEMLALEGLRSRVTVPLYYKDEFTGALTVASKKARQFSTGNVDLVEKLGNIFAEGLENARYLEQVGSIIDDLKNSNNNLQDYRRRVGHEMKNPLTVLEQISKTIGSRTDNMTIDELKQLLGKIDLQIRAFHASVYKVVLYHQAEMEKIEYYPEKVLLSEIIHGVLLKMRKFAEDRNVQVKNDIAENMPEITGDSEKLKYIFQELVSNAVKNTPKNGIIALKSSIVPPSWLQEKADKFLPPDVLENIDMETNQVIVSVVNTGVPIPPEQGKDIFKSPLDCTKNVEHRGAGIGIGLPLVKEMVELHRGHIWLENVSDRGNKFSFNLPQYSSDWIGVRMHINDKIKKARRELSSLSVLALVMKNSGEAKRKAPAEIFTKFIDEMVLFVRHQIREPLDCVKMYHDNETLLIIGKADRKEAVAIKRRVGANIVKMSSKVLDFAPQIEFAAVTYPDDVLDVDQLVAVLDERVRQVKEPRQADQ